MLALCCNQGHSAPKVGGAGQGSLKCCSQPRPQLQLLYQVHAGALPALPARLTLIASILNSRRLSSGRVAASLAARVSSCSCSAGPTSANVALFSRVWSRSSTKHSLPCLPGGQQAGGGAQQAERGRRVGMLLPGASWIGLMCCAEQGKQIDSASFSPPQIASKPKLASCVVEWFTAMQVLAAVLPRARTTHVQHNIRATQTALFTSPALC